VYPPLKINLKEEYKLPQKALSELTLSGLWKKITGVSRTNPWGSHGRRGYGLPWDFLQVGAE